MTSTTKPNIKIYGEGSSFGGDFQKVTIMGQGKVTSDFQSMQMKVFGESQIEGKACINRFHLFGSTSFHRSLVAKRLKIFGNLDV
ncbi:hypothetical protein [Alkalihalobacterium elongatum]|uniref:hypothetical protein n=1 Tax=Alkalihalobacterium elongatum TaxID=2675466 RepID=UPI001C1FC097|nr:hypothetical protein [Alkalihalobacterium elongatum]